jgi:ABC-2 type transport system ATP-binding protein
MIQVQKLCKTYGDTKVLQKVSFTIKKNEIFGLLGPNGAGKTTTLECIEGLRAFEEGSIYIDHLSPDQALKTNLIGVQLQNASLPDHMNIKDLLTLYSYWKKQDFNHELFTSFGLDTMYQKLYKNLSTGQKRRCHLALALIANPDYIFLDEPTAGLDVDSRHQLHQTIFALKKQGKTIILSSHDMAEVQHLCDRVAILIQGKIHAIDSPKSIINQDTFTNTMDVKLDKNIPSFKLKQASYVKKSGNYHTFHVHKLHQTLEDLMAFVNKENYVLEDLILDKPSLEERFLQLTKERSK